MAERAARARCSPMLYGPPLGLIPAEQATRWRPRRMKHRAGKGPRPRPSRRRAEPDNLVAVYDTQGQYQAEPLQALTGDQGKGPRPRPSRGGAEPEQPGCALPHRRPGRAGRATIQALTGDLGKRPSAQTIPRWRRALKILRRYIGRPTVTRKPTIWRSVAVIVSGQLTGETDSFLSHTVFKDTVANLKRSSIRKKQRSRQPKLLRRRVLGRQTLKDFAMTDLSFSGSFQPNHAAVSARKCRSRRLPLPMDSLSPTPIF